MIKQIVIIIFTLVVGLVILFVGTIALEIPLLNPYFFLLFVVSNLVSYKLRNYTNRKWTYFIPIAIMLISAFILVTINVDDINNQEGYSFEMFVIGFFFLMGFTMVNISFYFVVEYTYFNKVKKDTEKLHYYLEVFGLVFMLFYTIITYFTWMDRQYDVNHINIIIIILLFNMIYLTINLIVKYFFRIKKFDFAYIAVVYMIAGYFHFEIFIDINVILGVDDTINIMLFTMHWYLIFKIVSRILKKNQIDILLF